MIGIYFRWQSAGPSSVGKFPARQTTHAACGTTFTMSNVIDATEITVVEDKPSSSATFQPVFTISIKVMLSLIADLKKDLGGGAEASLKSAFQGQRV